MSTSHQQVGQLKPEISNAGPQVGQWAAPSGDSAAGAAAERGGTGAPPSNTAPDNCNFSYRLLRFGVDSLYLSYPGLVDPEMDAGLRTLKELAQQGEVEARRAQIRLGGHLFSVKDKSSGLFAYTLVNDAYLIRVSTARGKRLPLAYVKVSSALLSHQTVAQIADELLGILSELGEVQDPKVSRIDLFADFASDLDMESWGRDSWVTKAHAINRYAVRGQFTGWTIGEGGAVMARLYQKVLECQASGKTYLLDLWREVGWDGEMPVWRLEFEFKREILGQFSLDGLQAVLAALGGLWDYATTQWLKLTVPSDTDSTRSRWPIHPLWLHLAAVDWEQSGGPLTRSYPESHGLTPTGIGMRSLQHLAELASLTGLNDLDATWEELRREVDNAWRLHAMKVEMRLDDAFTELVEVYNWKHNRRLNPPPKRLPDRLEDNPYYRAKKGL